MDGIAEDLPGVAAERTRIDRDAAFAALAERHGRLLYRVAFGLLRNQQDAEDAVQETLLKLYRGDAWQAMEDEQAFLARAVWRAGLTRLGSAGAKAMRNSEDVTGLELAAAGPNPEQAAVAGSERALMRSLVEALPETLRQALVLSAVEGMRSNQVAAILEIPEGTVRTRVMRAKAELRRRFLDRTQAGLRSGAEVRS
jgi:RNA polymerase sigma-70 factor (ECF subfamily)